ncbi:MAG: helix-turn-helix transcriptional regulator [Clostridia bacterium]|nr:helix-turn-helix transcriptional regulator [Clostridia bacterium]
MDRVCTSRFLLSSFSSTHSFYPHKHFCDARTGKQKTSITYIAEGNVTIKTAGREIPAKAGDLIYLPDGMKYTSAWTGDPNVEFYSVHFDFSHLRETRIDRTFEIQSISKDQTGDLGELFRSILENYGKDDSERLLALSNFYLLWSKILPLLYTSEKISFSPQITAALEFIEAKYLDNFPVSELAKHCHLSESRLYHKFSDEMHCSPIHYRNSLRIQKAIEYLRDGNYSISEISDKLNFNSVIYFRKIFKSMTGFAPMEYKKIRREQK